MSECGCVLVFNLHTGDCLHVTYVCVCSYHERVLVFMLHTCVGVHVAYLRLCSCCVVPEGSGLGPRVYADVQVAAQGVH